MKKYTQKLYSKSTLLLIALLGILQACKDDGTPQVFSEVPSVRVQKQITKVRELLKSSADGWKMTYFTDSKKLGGFTYLFNFVNDKKVKMNSDFAKEEMTESEYNIIEGSTIKLSFVTGAKIHELSDSNNFPLPLWELAGKGYKGDFEFLYYGQDGEDLIFRTNRDFIELRFKKATPDDWKKLAKNKESQASLNNYPLAYHIGSKKYTFLYNPYSRFATNTDSENTSLNFGISFTPTGIVTNPAINVNGKKYSKFTFSPNKKQLVSLDGKFSIHMLSPPMNMNQDWVIRTNNTDVSPSFLVAFTKVKITNTIRWGESLSKNISFGNTTIRDKTSPGILFDSTDGSKDFAAQYLLVFGGVLDQLNQLAIYKFTPAFGWIDYKHLTPMVDFIVKNAPYKIEPTPLVNPTEVKLTSVKDPNVWFIIRRR